jgi:HEAT repeat protein
MVRSRSNEVTELVKRLGSRSTTRVDAARARLTIIGGRSVESLIEALEGDNNTIRKRVMPLLALIQDSRGREPLIAMLLDRNSRLRAIAAQSLARFPSPGAVAALGRTLDKERSETVRVAAVRSLAEHYASGQEAALRPVLERLMDSREETGIRLAAFGILRSLHPSQRRSVLNRLEKDAQAEVRETAAGFPAAGERDSHPGESEILGLLADLVSQDYIVWNAAVERLGACGASIVPRLIEGMQRRAHDPEFCTRAGMVLKALGPRRCRNLAAALDTIEEPLPLGVLIDAIGALGHKPLIYRLKALLGRLAEMPRNSPPANGFDLMQRARAKAHLELARIGSRVAIEDLRTMIADTGRRLEPEALSAVELIGKRDEILPLLRAFVREDRFMKDRISDVVRAIMRRERIRRNNRIFLSLSRAQRLALEAILPATRERRSARRTALEAG